MNCYRNLNKHGFFSIQQRTGQLRGKISGYAPAVLISAPTLNISEAGRSRVLKEKRKNVHAFLRGTLYATATQIPPELLSLACQVISYSPYHGPYFFDTANRSPVYTVKAPFALAYGSNVYLFAQDPTELLVGEAQTQQPSPRTQQAFVFMPAA